MLLQQLPHVCKGEARLLRVDDAVAAGADHGQVFQVCCAVRLKLFDGNLMVRLDAALSLRAVDCRRIQVAGGAEQPAVVLLPVMLLRARDELAVAFLVQVDARQQTPFFSRNFNVDVRWRPHRP